MKNSEKSMLKIQNKPLFYGFMLLFIISILFNSTDWVSRELASTYSNMLIGFSIGVLTAYGITKPEFTKNKLKKAWPVLAAILLVGVVYIFYMKNYYGF